MKLYIAVANIELIKKNDFKSPYKLQCIRKCFSSSLLLAAVAQK